MERYFKWLDDKIKYSKYLFKVVFMLKAYLYKMLFVFLGLMLKALLRLKYLWLMCYYIMLPYAKVKSFEISYIDVKAAKVELTTILYIMLKYKNLPA